jgi:hypothetical protein
MLTESPSSVLLHQFQLLKQFTDFNKIWHERCSSKTCQRQLLRFMQSLIKKMADSLICEKVETIYCPVNAYGDIRKRENFKKCFFVRYTVTPVR